MEASANQGETGWLMLCGWPASMSDFGRAGSWETTKSRIIAWKSFLDGGAERRNPETCKIERTGILGSMKDSEC